MVGNPFSHLLNSFQAKKNFFLSILSPYAFLCTNLKKIFFFENRGKSIFSSSKFISYKKKIFFCQYRPLTDFHLPTLKILFFSKMVGNPFSHRLDSFEAKKICFANNAPWLIYLKNFFFSIGGNPFSHILDSFQAKKKIFFCHTPLYWFFMCQLKKIFIFENGGKFIFSSSRFILSKKNFFLSILPPWQIFHVSTLKNFFFRKWWEIQLILTKFIRFD